jgi:hypothetical protein
MKNTVQTFIFDRSNPFESVAFVPLDNENFPIESRGKHLTRLDELRRVGYERNDLAMINIWSLNGVYSQEVAYGLTNGQVNWNGIKDFFTPDEQLQVESIVRRIKRYEKIYPEMLKLLHKA